MNWPDKNLPAFSDVNDLRNDLRHDMDHGKRGRQKAKRRKVGAAFQKYGGVPTPETLDPERFVIVQADLLGGRHQRPQQDHNLSKTGVFLELNGPLREHALSLIHIKKLAKSACAKSLA